MRRLHIIGGCKVSARDASRLSVQFLPPANEVCRGYVFTGDRISSYPTHAPPPVKTMHAPRKKPQWWGHAWLLQGGVHGFCWGACVVFAGGHACFFPWGACMFFSGGHTWFLPGGHVWFFQGGGMRGFYGGACVGYDEIRSMSGRYASYRNAFLFFFISMQFLSKKLYKQECIPA